VELLLHDHFVVVNLLWNILESLLIFHLPRNVNISMPVKKKDATFTTSRLKIKTIGNKLSLIVRKQNCVQTDVLHIIILIYYVNCAQIMC